MVAYTCDPSTWEGEIGRVPGVHASMDYSQSQVNLGYSETTPQTSKQTHAIALFVIHPSEKLNLFHNKLCHLHYTLCLLETHLTETRSLGGQKQILVTASGILPCHNQIFFNFIMVKPYSSALG